MRPGYNVLVIRHRGKWVLDRLIVRAPLKFHGRHTFVDEDGLEFVIPLGGWIEVCEEQKLIK